MLSLSHSYFCIESDPIERADQQQLDYPGRLFSASVLKNESLAKTFCKYKANDKLLMLTNGSNLYFDIIVELLFFW